MMCTLSAHRQPQYESDQVSCSAGHSLMNIDTTLRWMRARPAGVLDMKLHCRGPEGNPEAPYSPGATVNMTGKIYGGFIAKAH